MTLKANGMKRNLHTHSTFCDGRNTPEEMVLAAIEKGFDEIGFSSHAMFPEWYDYTLPPARAQEYVACIRALAEKYKNRICVRCGLEADYIPGFTTPDKSRYADLGLDYLIGSIHFVLAPDGARVAIDHEPQMLVDGINDHFGGHGEQVVRAYLGAVRDMARTCDFDIVGHPDLFRKFNGKLHFFDESADWYREEIVRTADALVASGKIVEINTGAISRGWMDDAYPSAEFRARLVERGVKLILNSDAHFAEALDCAFDRFSACASSGQ